MSVETPKATKPQVAMKAEVSYATSLTGDKTKIGYVQKVGQLKTLKEGQTYSALDLDEERMAKGKRKAETVDIEMMFIQEEHKAMGVIADADTDFIKDTMRVFKNSKVVETDGYPVEGDSTKF